MNRSGHRTRKGRGFSRRWLAICLKNVYIAGTYCTNEWNPPDCRRTNLLSLEYTHRTHWHTRASILYFKAPWLHLQPRSGTLWRNGLHEEEKILPLGIKKKSRRRLKCCSTYPFYRWMSFWKRFYMEFLKRALLEREKSVGSNVSKFPRTFSVNLWTGIADGRLIGPYQIERET